MTNLLISDLTFKEGFSMQYFTQLHQHLVNRDYSSFLGLWDEYCCGDEVDAEEVVKILEDVKNSDFSEAFGRYVEKALPLWKKLPEGEEAHLIFKLIIDLISSEDPSLANLILDYITKRYSHEKNFEQKLKLVGLRDLKEFRGAVSNFELLCHMNSGNFVFHMGGWGVGEIVDVSFLREQLCLEFDYVAGKKDLSFQNAFKNLLPIPKDHFLARRFGNPDALEALAKKNPVEVIKMLLKDLGPKSAAEIKDEICELIIPADEWVKWWQAARIKLKKDASIEVPEELKESFRLRTKDVGHEERLHKALEKKVSVNDLIQIVYTHLRDFPSLLKNETFKTSLEHKIHEALSAKDLTQAQELGLRFFLEDLASEKNQKEIHNIIHSSPSITDLVRDVEIISFKKRILTAVRQLRKDWVSIFLELLFKVDLNPLRDYILDELLDAKQEEELKKRLLKMLEFPAHYPTALVWYFKKIMESKSKFPLADKQGRGKFFEAFLILLGILDRSGASNKELVKKMLDFLSTGRYANVRKIFQDTDIDEIQEFLLLATKCLSLTDHDIKIFHSLAEVVHPSLAKLRKKYEDEIEEDIIWTTEKGLQKVKARIEEIGTVETVENAKEIEIARSHGDLRENSEFKFALEKRDRLQGELKFLSDQIAKARIITKEDVSIDKVGVGVIVECVDQKGKEVSYTLLGPWEASSDHNILSFQSKLAQEMKGLKIGDTFKIQQQEYKIKKIKSYFD